MQAVSESCFAHRVLAEASADGMGIDRVDDLRHLCLIYGLQLAPLGRAAIGGAYDDVVDRYVALRVR